MIGPPQTPQHRRPVSQQRYAVRRMMVITVLVLLGSGAYKGITELTDENEASGQEPDDSAVASSAGDSSVAAAPTVATTPPPTTAPPTTEAERSGPPTEDNPANVLIVGDSDAGTFAPYLEPMLDESGVVDVKLDYVVSSGLARPDFHDWQQHLRESMASSDPDIVIITFGGNDAQGLTASDGDVVEGMPTADNAAEWQAEYVSRVSEALDTILADGDVTVVWVGIPNAQDPEFTTRLHIQDQAVRQALASHPDVIFVDTWELFDGRNGGIAEIVVDPRDGKAKRVRGDDGFHLNSDGADILAAHIAAEVDAVLGDMGTTV